MSWYRLAIPKVRCADTRHSARVTVRVSEISKPSEWRTQIGVATTPGSGAVSGCDVQKQTDKQTDSQTDKQQN